MKKSGFTLIELLAVIVILAIIALITVPTILGVIEKARQGAAKASALSYMEAVELYSATSELKEQISLKSGEKYNLIKPTTIDGIFYPAINKMIDIKGKIPTGEDNYIVLDEDYSVESGYITINGYNIEIKEGKVATVVKGEIIKVTDIKLNIENQTMERGSKTNLEVTFEPIDASNQEVTYKSSNEGIVTVSDKGVITAVKNGTAEITVTSKDNKNIKKIIKVEVIAPENVESITIETEKDSIYVGEELQLTATLEPMDATSNAVDWSSSNSNIALVSESGKVTGIKVGKTTITAKTTNGKEAKKEIEILPVLAESITIESESNISIGSTVEIKATILPENTTDKTVTWTSSNKNVASISSDGKITANNIGMTTITATTTNGKTITKDIAVGNICKRAQTLHTEVCAQTGGTNNCLGSRYASNEKITYGNLGTKGTLVSGDAFDCDVDGNGTYDADERFYYVTDLETNSNYAVLIYYSNVIVQGGNVVANNTSSSAIAYDISGENWHGPMTAISNLPSTNDWKNVSLYNTNRTITAHNGATNTIGGEIENPFNYNGKSARLITHQEINKACNITTGSNAIGELDNCNYLLENTLYSSYSRGTYGYWLEGPNPYDSSNVWIVVSDNRIVYSVSVINDIYNAGVRPVIEVPKLLISY